MKFLNNINLTLNEVQNAKLHILATAPTGYEGLQYYDSTLKKKGLYANGAWKYTVESDREGAALGVATLDSSSLVVQNPTTASTLSGGNVGKIPISTTGGRLDVSYIPTLDNTPLALASVNLNNQKIINLAEPVNPQDATTKNYVDTAVQGLDPKASVRAGTIANITLSGTQTIDGIPLSIGDRVLVKNQTNAAENGIYLVAAGAWGRTLDGDSWNELVSAYVFVESSSPSTPGTNADTGWTCTAEPGGTLETTGITWTQFSAAGQINAANVGTGAGELFRSKDGITLNFKTLKTNSTRLSIANNGDDVTP